MKNLITLITLMMVFCTVNAQDFVSYYNDAENLFKAGLYNDAARKYEAYEKSSGKDMEEYIRRAENCKAAKELADRYFKDKKYEEALVQYNEIVELNENDSYAKQQAEKCLKFIDESKVIGGRDISFGVSAGIVNANYNTSFSGDYAGSPIDYAFGDAYEKPSYSSKTGFSVGLIADIKIIKNTNFYLQTGINFVNVKVVNSFRNLYGEKEDYSPPSTTHYYIWTAYQDFSEKYELNYLEIPLLLSYRFKLSKRSNLQVNLGSTLSFGISGECNFSGTTDWSYDEYYYSNNNPTDRDIPGEKAIISGNLDLFGKTGSRRWERVVGEAYLSEDTYEFMESPYKKMNVSLSIGACYEWNGLFAGIYYDLGLINIANDKYWNLERLPAYSDAEISLEGYRQKINKLQLKVGYIHRW